MAAQHISFFITSSFLWIIGLSLCVAEPYTDNSDSKPLTPEEQLTKFHVPPGFEVQLVAAENEIAKPLNITFDAAGRLWVTSTEIYPWAARTDALGDPIPGFDQAWEEMASFFKIPKTGDATPNPPEHGHDTIRVLSDFAPDGHARKVQVYAKGLNIPIGIQPLPREPGAKGDTVIAHSIPSIWKFTDTDGDGVADQRERLYTGFGFKDTHGMSSNYEYAYDGWIYGCHGFANHSEVRDVAGQVTVLDSGNTYRFKTDGSKFEYYSHGQTNPFGLTSDEHGDFYTCDSHSRPSMLVLPGGYYEGIGKQQDGLGFAPRIMEHDHGSSAIAGIAWYGATQFPAEFRNNTFNGNPVTRKINRDRYEWTGSTPSAVAMPDFVTCDDPWFRPVQVKLGPDGALYIGDFYNAIIGHYETPLLDPRRDRSRGRIWRVVWRGENKTVPIPTMPDLTKLDTEALIAKLADDNLVVRRLAVNELVDRVGKDAVTALRGCMADQSQPAIAKSLAAFALQRLGEEMMADTASTDSAAATLALRLLGEKATWSNQDRNHARAALTSSDARTRRATVLSIARHPEGLIASLLQARSLNKDDQQLQYALLIALRDALLRDGGYTEANLAIADDREGYGDDVADASLAVPTVESARFLIAYLSRSKLKAARADEYLRFIVQHLPADQISSLTAMLAPAASLSESEQLRLAGGLAQALAQKSTPLPPALADWMKNALTNGLRSSDDAITTAAILVVRDLHDETTRPSLVSIYQDKQRPAALRAAALESLNNLPDTIGDLRSALNDTSALPLRLKAAALLRNRLNDAEAASVLLNALSTAPGELAIEIAFGVTSSDSGAAALCGLIEQGKAPATLLRQRTVAANMGRRSQVLKDRADTLTKNLPAEDSRLDALIVARAKAYAATKPDPRHGAQVYSTFCVACHRLHGNGGLIGPNLDGIRSRGPQRLIEDILDPNRNVDPLFHQNIIETTGGQTLIGMNLREEDDKFVFTDVAGQSQSIAPDRVKTRTKSVLSLMPAGFENIIAEKDFYDLLAYLMAEDTK